MQMAHHLKRIMCAAGELVTSSSDEDFVLEKDAACSEDTDIASGENNSSGHTSANESDDFAESPAKRRVISDIILICCVCLENTNTDENEIMFCDNCGYAVHEECYGVVEAEDSTDSSDDDYNPTSFWFCEACCAGVNEPSCELCPNVGGGIYKRTDDNRWVHMVCAIYNKYVTFHDTNLLWPVDLSDVPSNTFGQKACIYCTDVLYSRTGICVPCEAGLCKASFHVTCGQRNGLLIFISTEQNDPCLCYCKQHSDSKHVQQKLQDYEALQAFAENVRNRALSLAEKQKKERHLKKSRDQYRMKLKSFVKTEVIVKKTRPITSCPSALRSLLKKSKIVGNTNACETMSYGRSVTPAFNVEFVNYFLEREQKITEFTRKLKELEVEHEKLTKKEKKMVENYEKMKNLANERQRMSTDSKVIFELLSRILGKQVSVPNELQSILAADAKVGDTKKLPFNTCTVCGSEQRQDMIVKCDTCMKYYHLNCLDPPLKVLPKKSRLYGWQCSFCTVKRNQSDSDSDMECSDLRVLRSTTRNSSFYVPQSQDLNNGCKSLDVDNNNSSSDSNALSISAQSKTGVIGFDNQGVILDLGKKDAEKNNLCKICGQSGRHDNMASCDRCSENFHFTCLNPPLLKNPKSRGYQWLCHACWIVKEDKKSRVK